MSRNNSKRNKRKSRDRGYTYKEHPWGFDWHPNDVAKVKQHVKALNRMPEEVYQKILSGQGWRRKYLLKYNWIEIYPGLYCKGLSSPWDTYKAVEINRQLEAHIELVRPGNEETV